MSATQVFFGAPAPVTERGTPASFDVTPDGQFAVYGNKRNVVVRHLYNPAEGFIRTGHKKACRVARVSPDGKWCASADAAGKIQIWDFQKATHDISLEKSTAGQINDMAWDSSGTNLVAGGVGGAMAFVASSGSALGDPLRAHGRDVLSLAYRPIAPFAIASSSMDFETILWKGPPFVLDSKATGHTNFVNCARFSPDGSKFITVSSDKKGLLFDGETGEKCGELTVPKPLNAHSSSIYGVAWAPDSAQIVTAASDKTCKIWDAAGVFVKTVGIGAKKKKDRQIQHQQLACAWGAAGPISLGLNGDFTLIDPADWSITTTIVGHQGPITCFAADNANGACYTGSGNGDFIRWDADGSATRVKGSVKNDSSKVHKGTITCACVVGDVVLSAGYDNAVRAHSTASGDLAGEGTSANGQPKQLAASASGVVVMMTSQGIALVSPAGVVSGFLATTGKTPLCVAINPEGTEVAMGCSETQDITVYAIAGGAFTETMPAMTMRGKVTALAYSPDGATLAAGDDQCQVMIWKTEDRSRLLAKWSWGRHGSKIACLSWSPDGTRVASGSGDNHIFLWKPSEARGYLQIPRAHPEGVVDVGFTADDVLASVGRDGALRKWKIA